MPILIVVALIAAMFIKFPYVSMLSLGGVLYFITWSAQRQSKLKQLERQRYLDDVAAFKWRDSMDPIEFERRCAEAMRLAGWTAQTTKGSGDQGVDVFAEQNGIRVVLQCKRYSNKVGNKAVQEAFAAKTFAKAHHAAVVTNSQFTPAARALAASTGVLLLHFTDLARPNKIFGLPDIPSLHRPSDVTDEQISRVRQSRIKPAYFLGFSVALVLAFLHDLSQTDTSVPPTSVTPTAALSGGPSSLPVGPTTAAEAVPARNQSLASTSQRSADAPMFKAAAGQQAQSAGAGSSHQKRPIREPLKTTVPAFLHDGDTFCGTAADFDKHWQWSLSGDRAHEPITPSCVFIFGQPRPPRVSVLQRASSNKTMIRVEDGDLAGRTGYTDAYFP